MDKRQKDMDREKNKKMPQKGEKGDRYEIDRGKEPHKEKHSPDKEDDQTR